MKDLMIDIETLDTLPTAAVLSIGAVYFDRRTGEIGGSFYSRISFVDAITLGSFSDSTMNWWGQQSDEARNEAFSGMENAIDVARNFNKFIKPNSLVWGNGSVFDITILENWFRACNTPVPWKFWNVRDVRTIVDWFNIDVRSYKREGVHHNALDDCLHQIKYICGGSK